jgi:DNA polymerase IV
MERHIIHLNVSYFMATIESVCNKSFTDRPIVIAQEEQARAVILDHSLCAYKEGIRRGMPLKIAQARLKDLIVVSPHPELYHKAESAMYELANRFSPIVEQAFKGHIYLDTSGTERLFGNVNDLAYKIKKEFQRTLNLDPIIGLSTNKLVSKVATRIAKPAGLQIVNPGDEAAFLSPYKIILLPGVGPKLQERLANLGVSLIGNLADLSDDQAFISLGAKGIKLRDAARGLDFTPVMSTTNADSLIVSERVLADDTNNLYVLEAHVFDAVEEAGYILRQQNLSTRKLFLMLYYTDGLESNSTVKLTKAIYTDQDLFRHFKPMLHNCLDRRTRIRKIYLSLSYLTCEHQQLELFTPEDTIKEHNLQLVIDNIRDRYGKDALKFAITMKN